MRLLQFAFYAATALLPLPCSGLLEEEFVSFDTTANGASGLSISDAPIVYSQDDFRGVHIAVNSLARDLEEITGRSRALTAVTSANISSLGPGLSSAIIVGSANSSLIQRLSADRKLDISDIAGKWETFKTAVVERPLPGVESALVIAGSDKRGAIFGVHTLAEQCGQSPYHFFADVPAKKHSQIYAARRTTVHGEPSVRYRGLFINDEEPALNRWWAGRHNATRWPLDGEFYSHVFDLLLRLRANYLWPAMWKSWTPPPGNVFFTDDPANQRLADEYGVVVSTAHHEPMQRATNEWDEAVLGPWDWSRNKGNVTRFMDEGVARAGRNESYFTVGMRGLGDEAANTRNAIEMLRDVFRVQRGIIAKYHGAEDAVNQVWALYKEVASYYDAGLDPPEDVTLLFPDDNQGNVYRLPTGNETGRKGGTGVYFHLEYVGLPRSYKWGNTNSLPKILKELYQSHLRGANRMWVINVGDIKPMELPFGFAMDIAWNASRFSSFDSIPLYLERYAAREFGADHAKEIADILLEHSHLIGMRRYELVTPGTFSLLHYHEAERILARWKALAARAAAVRGGLPEDARPAFFQLVYHPVVSGATYYAVTVGQGRNYQSALERRNSANDVAARVLRDFEASYDLVEEWDSLLGGKWRGMMSQAVYDVAWQEPKSWAPPARDMVANLSYVQLRQDMQFSLGNLGIYAEESLSPMQQGRWSESVDASMPTVNYPALLPAMDPYGPAVRTVDLFHRGDHRAPLSWRVENVSVDWLSVSPLAGTLDGERPEQRLSITVDWVRVPEGFNSTVSVGVTSTPSKYPYFDLIRVPVLNKRAPEGFKGFPETAGHISIEAPHFQRSSSSSSPSSGGGGGGNAVKFEKMSGLGSRSESGSIGVRPFLAARERTTASVGGDNTAAMSAWVEYDVYLFHAAKSLDATVYVNACLDTDPQLKMRFSLSLDPGSGGGGGAQNFTRLLGDYITNPYAGDIPPEWMDHVADQVWTKKVGFGPVSAGKHTLRWAVNSPEVYLEKIVLGVNGGVKDSYLGPPETMLV